MSFDKSTSTSSPPPIFVSPALISMILVVCAFLFATWHAFSTQNFAWLAIIPGIPLAVFFLNRRDYFFLTIIFFASANIWMPIMGNDVPIDIFLRLVLVLGILGATIISRAPAATWDLPRISLVVWAAIVLMTMAIRGSGIRQLGSPLWGGKGYIILLTMMLFLLVIPRNVRLTRKQWISVPIMIAILPIVPLLADLLYIFSGGKLYFLYYIFQPSGGVTEATTSLLDQDLGWRIKGTSRLDLLMLLLIAMPWLGRSPHGKISATILFVISLGLASLGGFRGALLTGIGIALIYAWYRTVNRKLIFFAIIFAAGMGLITVGRFLGTSLPSPLQRVLTIVPFSRVDPIVEIDAAYSSRWRLQIWEETLRTEVRPHLIVGRGLCFDPNRLIPQYGPYLDEWSVTQNAVVNGNFHSGPLSALVMFGVPGFICLLVFMVSAIVKHLRIQRMQWHDPLLQQVHFVFLCYFLYATVAFYLLYGDLTFMMIRHLSFLCILEMLGNTRREEVDQMPEETSPAPLVAEPVRARAIRYF